MRKIRSQVHDFYANDRGSGLMRKPTCHQSRHFTLLEILVAIAVLVVMMGFIFQFINSALKIWSASKSTSEIFDQAQLVFDMLEHDLQNLHFVSDEDYPGHAIPMGVINVGAEHRFFLVTAVSPSNEDNIGTHLVMYVWTDESDESSSQSESDESPPPPELSRNVLDDENSFFFYGCDPAKNLSTLTKNLPVPLEREVIATGVQNLSIVPLPVGCFAEGEGYFTSCPKVVKVSLTLYDAAAIQQLQSGDADDAVLEQKKIETARRFSKIIFLR